MLLMLSRFKKIVWPLVYRWRKLVYPYKVKGYERELFKKYNSTEVIAAVPRIIYMLDENFANGGFVDRLKGLISAYFLATQYGKKFAVFIKDSNDPFLSLINQKEVDIITNQQYLNFNGNHARPIVWYNFMPAATRSVEIALSGKSEIHLYCNMNMLAMGRTSSGDEKTLWSDIFKKVLVFPTPNDIFSINKSNIKIGIHLRFIGLLGDFTDLREYKADIENRNKMLAWCEDKLLQVIKIHPGATFGIVTDSVYFLNNLSSSSLLKDYHHLFFYSTEHIGHTALDNDPLIFQKTIHDFRLLASSSSVYQLRFGKMHRSDFSRYAAMSSNVDFHLIEE